jgi:lipoprotein-releasing system permease protein
VVILNHRGTIDNYEEVIEKVRAESEILALSPFVLGQVMVSAGKKGQGVYIRGIDPDREAQTTEIGKHLKEGSLNALEPQEGVAGIILGSELAGRLGVFLNDTVSVLSPTGEIGPLGMLPKVRKFRVAGIFDVGMFEYDSNLVIVSMKSAQEFFGLQDAVTGIEVKVSDIYKADIIRDRIQKTLGFPYHARDWMQMNKNLFSALKLEKFAMFVILVLIILVASFNIVSTLMMNVIEKQREIAILKTMGATNRGIMTIFLIQGSLIGIFGTVLGLLGGLLLSYIVNSYELIKLPPDIYYLSHLPVKLKVADLLAVCVSAILISFLSTLYPAWQASKLDPIEPLRYE